MIRQIIVPTKNIFLLNLPDDLIGKKVEVIAFSTDDISLKKTGVHNTAKKIIEEAIAFYKKNAVDFTNVKKWNQGRPLSVDTDRKLY